MRTPRPPGSQRALGKEVAAEKRLLYFTFIGVMGRGRRVTGKSGWGLIHVTEYALCDMDWAGKASG